MSELIFAYNGTSINIQAQSNEILSAVIDRFCLKVNVNRNKIYFLNSGEKLNENLKVDEIKLNDENKRIILVNDNNDINNNNNYLKRSNEIICPECYKKAFIEIDNYKIRIKNCINKHNNIILINEFEDSQLIDLSKIICNNCKNINMGKCLQK